MGYGYMDIVYGIFVTWGDLVRLGYVQKDYDSRSGADDVKIGDCSIFYANAHSFLDEMEATPERLPPSYKRMQQQREEDDDFGVDSDEFDVMCVGIKVGRIDFGKEESDFPTVPKINAAVKQFLNTISTDLLLAGGTAELHFIPDDCICCT